MLKLLPLLLVLQVVVAQVNQLELTFVQVMWNHGDISPPKTYKNDPFQDANWTFGGGGFGQLSPLGMKQQVKLGRLLREKYVDTNYLSSNYTANEIYIRSTDTDRTIVSAMCNIWGMYGEKDETGEHYPKEGYWPTALIPIPVHTVSELYDHVGVPDAPCNRRAKLWKLALQSKDVVEFKNSDVVRGYLRYLSSQCGQEVRLDNFYEIRDILHIEQIHHPDAMKVEVPWVFESLYYVVNEIANQTQLYLSGIFNETVLIRGIDVGHEIKKVRGGAFINELNARMELKLQCIQNYDEEKCSFIKPLKYYAYSVHGSTMFQFFTLLGIEKKVANRVYPKYAAAAIVEFYINNFDNRKYFRLMYRPNDESDFKSVAHEIPECLGKEYCSIEVFKEIAEKFNPRMPMEESDQYNRIQVEPIFSSAKQKCSNLQLDGGVLLPPDKSCDAFAIPFSAFTVIHGRLHVNIKFERNHAEC